MCAEAISQTDDAVTNVTVELEHISEQCARFTMEKQADNANVSLGDFLRPHCPPEDLPDEATVGDRFTATVNPTDYSVIRLNPVEE